MIAITARVRGCVSPRVSQAGGRGEGAMGDACQYGDVVGKHAKSFEYPHKSLGVVMEETCRQS